MSGIRAAAYTTPERIAYTVVYVNGAHEVVQCTTCTTAQGGPAWAKHFHWRPAEELTSLP